MSFNPELREIAKRFPNKKFQKLSGPGSTWEEKKQNTQTIELPGYQLSGHITGMYEREEEHGLILNINGVEVRDLLLEVEGVYSTLGDFQRNKFMGLVIYLNEDNDDLRRLYRENQVSIHPSNDNRGAVISLVTQPGEWNIEKIDDLQEKMARRVEEVLVALQSGDVEAIKKLAV